MKIETKYNVGDHIWVVYEPEINNEYYKDEPAGEITLYDAVISNINISDEGIEYWLKDIDAEAKEEDVILYSDTCGLVERIKELMNKIHKRENND